MSRYVHIELRATSLDAVEAALSTLNLPYVRPRRRVRLEGSLECTGDPVDIRLEAGVCDTVEDFGFVVDDGVLRLVCGELDQAQLETALVPKLRQTTAVEAVERAVAGQGMRIHEAAADADGTRRLILELDD
ncbi:MAG: hypothetical protein ACRBN8_00845 [Nannocystales bacterium]